MDNILRGLDGFFVNINGILVASPSLEMHRIDFGALFNLLSENGQVVRLEKWYLGSSGSS